jgi:hypothetical protein
MENETLSGHEAAGMETCEQSIENIGEYRRHEFR